MWIKSNKIHPLQNFNNTSIVIWNRNMEHCQSKWKTFESRCYRKFMVWWGPKGVCGKYVIIMNYTHSSRCEHYKIYWINNVEVGKAKDRGKSWQCRWIARKQDRPNMWWIDIKLFELFKLSESTPPSVIGNNTTKLSTEQCFSN